MDVEFCQIFFFLHVLIEMIVWVFSFINIVNQIHCLLNMKPTLHSWDKLQLVYILKQGPLTQGSGKHSILHWWISWIGELPDVVCRILCELAHGRLSPKIAANHFSHPWSYMVLFPSRGRVYSSLLKFQLALWLLWLIECDRRKFVQI